MGGRLTDGQGGVRRRTVLRALGTLPWLGVVPLLQGCGVLPSSDQSPGHGWLPPPTAAPGALLVVDLHGLPEVRQVALAILQGAINIRLRPGGEALYLLPPAHAESGRFAPWQSSSAPVWANIYAKRGIKLHNGTPADAVALAQAAGIRDYVLWDPGLPATINVATTLAWLDGVTAIAPEDAHGSLASPLLSGSELALADHGWRQQLDLSAEHFADATSAYQWAWKRLVGHQPEALAMISVGDLPGDPTEGVLRWTPRDYAVVTRAFTWIGDMNSIAAGSHGGVLRDVAKQAGSRKFTAFGWTNNEINQTVFCSSHGMNFVGADSPGLPAANLSVHTAIPTTAAAQSPRPKAPPLDPSGVYVTIFFTDGDNISVLIDFHESRWTSSHRGTVSVGWSMQGMAPTWTAAMAKYYFDTATPQDEMIAWLPFGYPDLPSFVGHPNWQTYVASAQAAMKHGNFRVGQSFPHLPGMPSPEASGLWDMLHGGPDGYFLGYIGMGPYPAGEPLWIDGRPVLPVGGYGGANSAGGPTQAISNLTTTVREVPTRPLFLALGLGNGTKYSDAIDVARQSYPEKVSFVLPGQLVDLMRSAWQNGLARTTPLGTPPTSSGGPVDAYFLSPSGASVGSSQPGVAAATGRTLRNVANGGTWTYALNAERCQGLGLVMEASGQGEVAASRDGKTWTQVGTVAGGQSNTIHLDLRKFLPAAYVFLRFQAGASSLLTVTGLSVTYNPPSNG